MSMWASVAIGSSAMGAAVLGTAVEFLGLDVTLIFGAVSAGLLLAVGLVHRYCKSRPATRLGGFD